MPNKGRLIVLRFSAMGDVAMVASVLKEFAIQNPQIELVMVSRALFEPFFKDIPKLTFHAIHPKTRHKGVIGAFRLYKELTAYKPIAIADLHDNLRSRLLCTFFRLNLFKIKRINKGRAEKRALTRSSNKILKPLMTTVDRYAEVFKAIGFNFHLSHKRVKHVKSLPDRAAAIFSEKNVRYIGVSPFAQHVYKMYPLAKMEEVIARLAPSQYRVLIFGGGAEEQLIAEKWETKYENVNNLIGKFTLTEELAIMSHLDIMLSMDSAGMHMASLVGVRVISIWGPTHPYAGFLGYGQQIEDCIQVDHPARPNSVYGNKPCLCGNTPCIDLIAPEVVATQLIETLNNG